MKKIVIALLSLACIGMAAAGVACSGGNAGSAPLNGGFETGDLSGWTVEYGDAFNDDCVISDKTFTFANDVNHNEISVEATGNWYLSGKSYSGNYVGARTGAIRSTEFVIPKDGQISMKLAGGARTLGKDEGAAFKDEEKICFVGIYRASDNRLIAKQTNEYFNEHTEDYVNPDKYASGACHTDNFNSYTLNLSEYAGDKAYIRIVDNDDGFYYGYLAVDDIRVGADAEAQAEGGFFVKSKLYQTEAQAPSRYEIANGGFETGSLAGWTVLSGEAFSHDGVNTEKVYWNENIPYDRDGNYHYGYYRPETTGEMRSTDFELGGSGYISWKLGGCRDNGKSYISIMTSEGDREIARFSNFKFNFSPFPVYENGLHHLNLVQYYTRLPNDYIGTKLYIKVVDNSDSGSVDNCVILDSVQTYWEKTPDWKYGEAYYAEFDEDNRAATEYQIVNGGFERVNENNEPVGWTYGGERIGDVSTADTWWNEALPFNKRGRSFFNGLTNEGGRGTLTSSPFKVGGSGWITYLFGGGKNPSLCYLSIVDAAGGEELARFSNSFFSDKGVGTVNYGSNLANMVWYKADLSEFSGRTVKIRITDNATGDWGLITADSFVTYYEKAEDVPAQAVYAPDHAKTDKTKLLALVDEALTERGDYTDDSFNAYTRILNEARDLLGDKFAPQPTVNGLVKSVRNARNNLTVRVPVRNELPLPELKIAKGYSKTFNAAYYVDILGLSSITYSAATSDETALTVECTPDGLVKLTAGEVEEDTSAEVTVRVLYKELPAFVYKVTVNIVSSTAPQPAENPERFVDKYASSDKDGITINFADYIDNPADYTLSFTAEIDGVPVELNGSELRYPITEEYGENAVETVINVTVAFIEYDEPRTLGFDFKLYVCDTTKYRVQNGGFETGNLDGWEILTNGMNGGVISAETYWGERLPYNQAGNYHLDGWNTGIDESLSWAVRSSQFVLGGSGYISLRMGGRAAAVTVFKADGTQIGYYTQTRCSDANFPFVGDGSGNGSWADMGTYFIDLRDYIGETLYVELHDVVVNGNWAHAFFDEVVTYYKETPDIENGYDTVTAPVAPGYVYGSVNLKWTLAENKYNVQ